MYKIFILIFIFLIPSCIVQSPKYTTLQQVMELKVGMTKDEVEQTLGLQPYDLKAYTDTSHVFTYIYRTIDRRTLSFYTKKKNGRRATGKYVQLHVSYSLKNEVTKIETCSLCPDNLVTTSTIDISKIFTFITITLPVVLVYIGLKK